MKTPIDFKGELIIIITSNLENIKERLIQKILD